MGIKLSNNAVSTVANSISRTETSITVTSGDGALFPTLGENDYFYATLVSVTNAYEIVKVVARSGDTMTISRARENTTALAFPANSRIEHRVTAATLLDLVGGGSGGGGELTFPLDLGLVSDSNVTTSYDFGFVTDTNVTLIYDLGAL